MNIQYSYKTTNLSLRQQNKKVFVNINNILVKDTTTDIYYPSLDNLINELNNLLNTNERVIKINIEENVDIKQNVKISIRAVIEAKQFL